jgi:hypothetical protein
MDTLEEMALEAYDRPIGLKLSDVSVDCYITKAQCGGEKAGKARWTGGKGHQAFDDGRHGGQPSGGALRSGQAAMTRRFWVKPCRAWMAPSSCPSMRASTSIAPTTRTSSESFWQRVAWWA